MGGGKVGDKEGKKEGRWVKKSIIHNKSDFEKFLLFRLCYFSFRERARHEIPDAELEAQLLVGGSAEFTNIKAVTLH